MKTGKGTPNYEAVYRSLRWAYSDTPDADLIEALADVPRERALDLGGGQGRHALALAELGFEVLLVDSAAEGLRQAAAAAEERGLHVHVLHAEAGRWEPEGRFVVVVASLFFHVPARRTSLGIARRVGEAVEPGGLVYVSLPYFTPATRGLAHELMAAARCEPVWIRKALVSRRDRPRLTAPRRNETRALGRKPGSP